MICSALLSAALIASGVLRIEALPQPSSSIDMSSIKSSLSGIEIADRGHDYSAFAPRTSLEAQAADIEAIATPPFPPIHEAPPLAFLAQYGVRVGDDDEIRRQRGADPFADQPVVTTTAAEAATSGDRCESMPAAFDGGIFCWGVVDYPFFVPNGTTSQAMNAKVRALAARSPMSLLSVQCRSNIKRALCAAEYKPCSASATTGKVMAKTACKSLCDAVENPAGECRGVLAMYKIQPNCSDTSMYVSGNSSAQCNAMVSSYYWQIVADSHEPYIGSVCRPFVETVYNPSAASVSPTLAEMPIPYLLQAWKEYVATAWIGYMPKFVSSPCLTSFHKVVCGVIFMKPEASDEVKDVFGTVHVPMFPARELCTNYMDSCPYILGIAPALGLPCEDSWPGWDGGLMYMYPEKRQAVYGLMVRSKWVTLHSDPNRMDFEAAQDAVIATQCPYSTAVPEDPDMPGIVYATDGCALSCPLPIYTSSEFTFLRDIARDSSLLFVVIGSFILFNNYVFLEAKKQSIYLNLNFLILLTKEVAKLALIYGAPGDEAICSSNASKYLADEPPDGSTTGYNLCYASSVIEFCCFVAQMQVLTLLVVETWLVVAKGYKVAQLAPHRKKMFAVAAIPSIIWMLVHLIYGDKLLTDGSMPLCRLYHRDKYEHFYTYTLPTIILFGTCCVLLLHYMYQAVIVTARTPGGSFMKIFRTYKMMFMMNAIYFITMSVYIGVFFIEVYIIQWDSYGVGVGDWIDCIFANFVESSDTTYLDTCGDRPAVRYPLYLAQINAALSDFTAIAFLILTLTRSDVRKHYEGALEKALRMLGFKQIFSGSMARVRPAQSLMESELESGRKTRPLTTSAGGGTVVKKDSDDALLDREAGLGNAVTKPGHGSGGGSGTVALPPNLTNVGGGGGMDTERSEEASIASEGGGAHHQASSSSSRYLVVGAADRSNDVHVLVEGDESARTLSQPDNLLQQ